MVIDRSGSMAETSGNGRTKLDLAKEAVYQASLGLTPRDQISLIVFDDTADAVLPLQKLPPAIEIEQALSSFNAGSGTNIRPGIELAAEALATANAKIKHVILMTDGIAPSNYDDLIDQLRGAGVTISTVAIGDDAIPTWQISRARRRPLLPGQARRGCAEDLPARNGDRRRARYYRGQVCAVGRAPRHRWCAG